MSLHKKNLVPKLNKQEKGLLELPESTLDCILERLEPLDLCRLAQVCTALRDKCTSDDLWQKLVEGKWGRLLGDVAFGEWEWHMATISKESLSFMSQQNQGGSGSFGSFTGVWPSLSLNSYLEDFSSLTCLSSRKCSRMALYISLETGRFWFPAQVYRNAVLCCYDALVSYDATIDTFRARSPTGGWRLIEENVPWKRLRLSSVETSPWDFYMSNYMEGLKPGDHIEIQFRKRRELPYDWWYGVVGHLDSCDGDENHCRCQDNDMFVVEIKHFRNRARWRRAVLDRKVHKEQGSRFCLFGGIKKLDNEEEIARWNTLPTSLIA